MERTERMSDSISREARKAERTYTLDGHLVGRIWWPVGAPASIAITHTQLEPHGFRMKARSIALADMPSVADLCATDDELIDAIYGDFDGE